MSERLVLTDRARRALTLAAQEAQRLHHDHIGTEHMLLGMLKEGTCMASVVLAQLDVSIGTLRQKVEELTHGPSPGNPSPRLRQTERYTRVLTYANEEASALSNNYVGTEHLLLGLLREPEGTAARALAGLNLKLEDVRTTVLNLIGRSPRSGDALAAQAIKDLQMRLADNPLPAEKLRRVVEALISAGWRPQQ